MIDLSGKHILVVGGSRGIGAACVRFACQAGARVSLTYVSNSTAADALVAEVGGADHAIALQAAIDDETGVAAVCKQAADAFGPIDGLVVSAGIFEPAPIADMDRSFWERTMAINLTGNYLATRAALKHWNPAGGSMVFITSTAGQRGSDIYSAYATSKGGQIMFMRSMARELAPMRIRSNCVAPGWTETDMASDTIDDLGRQDIVNSIPLGRIGRPEDPAAAVSFLLSDLAQFITGSTITVDGGFDMRG